MNRTIIQAILKMFAKAVLLTTGIGCIILFLGYKNEWDSLITYSNAFFIAGCLLIIAGTASRMTAGVDWNSFQEIHSESFEKMSNFERTAYIVTTSTPIGTLILGVLTGLLLILISAITGFLL